MNNKNPFSGPNIGGLFHLKNIIQIDMEKGFHIEGIEIPSPIAINGQNTMDPEALSFIASAMAYNVSPQVHTLAGTGFGAIIAHEVSRIRKMKFLPIVVKDGAIVGIDDNSLEEERVALITHQITDGESVVKDVALIKRAGGECKEIFSMFDFNLNLSIDELKNIEIKSLLDLKTLTGLHVTNVYHTQEILSWMNSNKNLFGNKNRKKAYQFQTTSI